MSLGKFMTTVGNVVQVTPETSGWTSMLSDEVKLLHSGLSWLHDTDDRSTMYCFIRSRNSV